MYCKVLLLKLPINVAVNLKNFHFFQWRRRKVEKKGHKIHNQWCFLVEEI